MLAYRPVVGVSGWAGCFVFLGLVFDLGAYGGGAQPPAADAGSPPREIIL